MRQSCHDIETTQLICRANRLTGFYMMTTLACNELINVINNFIPNKTYRFDYKEPGYMKE